MRARTRSAWRDCRCAEVNRSCEKLGQLHRTLLVGGTGRSRSNADSKSTWAHDAPQEQCPTLPAQICRSLAASTLKAF